MSTELKPVAASVEARYPTVRVRTPNDENYGLPGTFTVDGFVTGTRIMVIRERWVVEIGAGSGSITLHVPAADCEVIS